MHCILDTYGSELLPNSIVTVLNDTAFFLRTNMCKMKTFSVNDDTIAMFLFMFEPEESSHDGTVASTTSNSVYNAITRLEQSQRSVYYRRVLQLAPPVQSVSFLMKSHEFKLVFDFVSKMLVSQSKANHNQGSLPALDNTSENIVSDESSFAILEILSKELAGERGMEYLQACPEIPTETSTEITYKDALLKRCDVVDGRLPSSADTDPSEKMEIANQTDASTSTQAWHSMTKSRIFIEANKLTFGCFHPLSLITQLASLMNSLHELTEDQVLLKAKEGGSVEDFSEKQSMATMDSGIGQKSKFQLASLIKIIFDRTRKERLVVLLVSLVSCGVDTIHVLSVVNSFIDLQQVLYLIETALTDV